MTDTDARLEAITDIMCDAIDRAEDRERFAELSACPAGREAEFARWIRSASHPEIVALRKLRGR
jgi:hypothetical protein